ncbi:hypothetical protein [Ammoniphilus sp. CFH 90114]|uniref:hypothetical protein n=1 Tax=Ammoniphilus sp. CFH 90114 TaxID=2493665 RepID=UPI00100E3505|nr:hypothetical protein [Ammoniphilus sp. CFH 90114]RXT08849.1 hypothetical protein EIZ39_08595 [Ammoniphilus sp. CFH 90114]
MTTFNHNEEELINPSEELSLVRPTLEALIDGKYSTTIIQSNLVKAGEKVALRLFCKFEDTEGNELEQSFLIYPNWKSGTPFRKLMELSGCMPDPGQSLVINKLIGQVFLFTMKVVSKDGREYVNLEEVSNIDEQDE